MLSKIPDTNKRYVNVCKLSILSCSSVLEIFQLYVFTNCIQYFMNGYLVLSVTIHEQSSNNNLFNRVEVRRGWYLNPQYLH